MDRTSQDNYDALIEQERLILDATELVYELMEDEGLNQRELAKRLGKSKGFVSQVLNGKRNMTLRTLADLFHVLGYRTRFQTSKLSDPVVPSRAKSNVVPMSDYWLGGWTPHKSWIDTRRHSVGRETAFGFVDEPATMHRLDSTDWHSFLQARLPSRSMGADRPDEGQDEPQTGSFELVS